MNDILIDGRNLSESERRRYYDEWQESGLKQIQFCQAQRLPLASFRYWHKKYQKEKPALMPGFSRVAIKKSEGTPEAVDKTAVMVGIKLANQTQLQLSLSVKQLIDLIRGIA